MYQKVIKYISWALLIVSVVIGVLGFAIGFNTSDAVAVDTLLYWAYAMVGAALAAIILIGIYVGATNNPKGLLKTALVVIGFAAIIAVAYLVAPGADAVGYNGEQPSAVTLKFTDTILILTYLSCGLAVLSIIAGAVVGPFRK